MECGTAVGVRFTEPLVEGLNFAYRTSSIWLDGRKDFETAVMVGEMKSRRQVWSDDTHQEGPPRLLCVKAPFSVSRVQNTTPHNHEGGRS